METQAVGESQEAETGAAARAQDQPVSRRRGVAWTAAIVGVGAAIIQPELIPGMLLGAAVALAPRYLPNLARSVRAAGERVRRMREETSETSPPPAEPPVTTH
jgi:hypothetical protein